MPDTDPKHIQMMPRQPEADGWAERLNTDQMPQGRWPEQGSVPVSVLVPVKNESGNLPECLLRLSWADQMVVVDSQSTDATVPIAQACGAEVYQFHYNPTVDWMKKKNWSITNIPWRHEWLLIMDADEYMTPELADEVRRVVSGEYKPSNAKRAGCGDGYWINRRFMFLGRWIKHCGYYPSYNVRLFKHKVGLYERMGQIGDTGSGDNEVHEHVILETGEAGYLEHDFLHYAYPDLSVWIEKHNRYSTWEAHVMRTKGHGNLRALFWGAPVERRRWLKIQSSYLPFRPLLRFLYTYVLRLGFLDGYPGFVMSKLMAWYEFISLAKRHEMDAQARPIKTVSGGSSAGMASGAKPVPVSVVVFTHNEQDNIGKCLDSCGFSDDVHVVDLGSSDGTCDAARKHGARVHSRSSDSFEAQCNWAIQGLDTKHEWRFFLNADERVRPELVDEIRNRVIDGGPDSGANAYRVPGRLILLDRWIRRSGGYPAYQIRLFKGNVCRFKDDGLVMRDKGEKVGTLEQPYDHHAFSKGLTDWFHLYNDYSTREADPDADTPSGSEADALLSRLWARDPMVHRERANGSGKSRPGRHFFRFFYLYFIRLGFLDGRAGFHYCSMVSNYAYWVNLKKVERQSQWFKDIDRLAEAYLREDPA